jgi:murein L,D-transpeptidase YcbB/YkuD
LQAFGLLHDLKRVRIAVIVALLIAAASLRAEPIASQLEIQSLLRGGVAARFADESLVQSFYGARGGTPAWSGSDLQRINDILKHSDLDGLDPSDYTIPSGIRGMPRDVLTTAATLAYMRDLRLGRSRLRRIDSDIALPEQEFDAVSALAEALKSGTLASTLAAQAPPQPEYARLKTALAFYRRLDGGGGWDTLPAAKGSDFLMGAVDPQALRRRLQLEDTTLSDSANLTDAVKRFQARHGLFPDGKVGKRTLTELNVAPSARVVEIVSNMERWRWLPRVFEPNFIAINVADAHLVLTLGGRQVLDSVVIVGRPHDPTPILRAEGAGVTLNPPWNVPASIARREILPKLKANPSYLVSQDMVLLNGPPGDPHGLHVDWRAIPGGTFPYRIQQHPGPKNSLGTIKIELPNRFDVYLHDTPAKGAFAWPARDISHGCVRVQQILPLASYALAANLDAMDSIKSSVAAGQTRYLPLQRRLPVYFLYWTTFTAADGSLQFRPDIYGRDKRLIAALSAPVVERVSANFVKCTRG